MNHKVVLFSRGAGYNLGIPGMDTQIVESGDCVQRVHRLNRLVLASKSLSCYLPISFSKALYVSA